MIFKKVIAQAFHHRIRYLLLLSFIVLFMNNSGLAITQLLEAMRTGNATWRYWGEPFIWEYSSAFALMCLLPMLSYSLNNYPPAFLVSRITMYGLLSIAFSLFHIALMVGFREFAYLFLPHDYNFAANAQGLAFELMYEYNKDLWTFIICLLYIKLFDFVVSRLHGEATIVAQSETQQSEDIVPERLLVKKLGKEFVINVADIEWGVASGNYVNLHIDQRVYPLRITLAQLTGKLNERGFCRIHRSYLVNLAKIQSLESLPSGDGELTLLSGKKLPVSRRYKASFKMRML